jgi:polar amino acid transport system substrate-binding protein
MTTWSGPGVRHGDVWCLAKAYSVAFLMATIVFGMGVMSATAATLAEIKQRGYMTVATENDNPPFEYVVSGRPRGYDTDLLAILKKNAGFEIRQEIVPRQEILPGVASGKYDAAVTAAVITAQAAKTADFTMPVAETPMAYIKRKSDTSIKGTKDLAGKTIGVLEGGASAQVLPDLAAELRKSGRKLGKVVKFGSYAEAYEALVTQRVDAVIQNATTLAQLVRETSGIFELGQQIGKKSYAAWAVKKGNRSVLEFLNTFLAEQKADGTFARLQAKYSIGFSELPNQPLLPGGRAIR